MGLREVFELSYFPPPTIRRRLIRGVFFLIEVSFRNPIKFSKINENKRQGKKYRRPLRRYDLPSHKPEMKYCRLNHKYLRPTLYCNSHSPEIIALAHQLGAYQKSDWDFAESAFEFVKRKVMIEMIPLDSVEKTLLRGTGTCLHRLSLLIALCRAAGIKAKYKLYSLSSTDTPDETVGSNELGKQWSAKMGELLYHGEAQVYIDGKWITGSVGLTAERQASLNLPITKFGDTTLGTLYQFDNNSVVELESIPYGINTMMKFVFKMATAIIDRSNASLLEQCNRGRALLEEKGEQAYNSEIRKTLKPDAPEAIMTVKKGITFER